TRHYRRAIDGACAGEPVEFSRRDVREMQLSFSRGFSHGFLDGNNHKVLVRGDYAKKRGILLGTVDSVTRSGVRLKALAPVKPGDGLVFDGDESIGRNEQGGRVFEVIPVGRKPHGDSPGVVSSELEAHDLELRFGRASIDLDQIQRGQRVWKTDD